MELMDGMGAFRLGSHLSCLFLTLGIRDLGYELDHAWEHTEADQKDPVDFVAPGAYQFTFSKGVLPINFMNHHIIYLSISGIGELIAL
jgi:hypothetical protein